MSEECPPSDVPKTTEDAEAMECGEVPADIQSSEPTSSSERESSTPQTASSPSGTVHSSETEESKPSEEEQSQKPTGEESPVSEAAAAVDVIEISPEKGKHTKKGGVKKMVTENLQKIKSYIKGLSPKSDKLALSCNTDETTGAEPSAAGTSTDEKVTVSKPKIKGRLTLDSPVDDIMTEMTSVSGASDVFVPDGSDRKESLASCDTGAHVSRLPSEELEKETEDETVQNPEEKNEDESEQNPEVKNEE